MPNQWHTSGLEKPLFNPQSCAARLDLYSVFSPELSLVLNQDFGSDIKIYVADSNKMGVHCILLCDDSKIQDL